jgi:NTE family protein
MANSDENFDHSDSAVGGDAGPEPWRKNVSRFGQFVLVLHGGGALGAYHGGVYEALHEAGIEPDWVVATSIGSVNGSLIAGNAPAARLDRLKEFWHRVVGNQIFEPATSLPVIGRKLPIWSALINGIDGFYAPNPLAFFGPNTPLPTDSAGLYSVGPLERTLNELVDFTELAKAKPRLTVGAANIKTSQVRYFDSRDMQLTARHLLASGAMPPAFTPIRVDGTHYWDGGLLSNTPIEVIFDDVPRRNSLVFSVQVWHPEGPLPESIWDVMTREKEMLLSSSATSQIARQKQLHHLRHVAAELTRKLTPDIRESADVRAMTAYGCLTQMHVVRLLAPRQGAHVHMSQVDFSNANINARWQAGYEDAQRALSLAPWEKACEPLEGFHWHEI